MASNISSDPSMHEWKEFLVAAFAVELFMLIFFWECKVYDLSTAMFTAWLLGWLARGKFQLYHAVFPVACINRETAFLLILVFAVYGLSRLSLFTWMLDIGYQVFAFISIRLFLIFHFMHSAGSEAWFRPTENLIMYIQAPLQTSIFLAGAIGVLWLCVRRWRQQPSLLRVAFVVMAPCLAILYLVFGYTFEIRAFAEIYPVAIALIAGVQS